MVDYGRPNRFPSILADTPPAQTHSPATMHTTKPSLFQPSAFRLVRLLAPLGTGLFTTLCLLLFSALQPFSPSALSAAPAAAPVPAKSAPKIDPARALAIAKKYWLLSSPNVEQAFAQNFKTLFPRPPDFDGKNKNETTALNLSPDIAILSTLGAPNITTALACAAFDAAHSFVDPAQNLGCAIASFADINPDPKIRARESEIYSDAETILQYAIRLSIDNNNFYTPAALEPLVALGNLYIDMKKYEDAREQFETALKILKTYKPALDGMLAYYQATKNSQKLVSFKEAAKQEARENPSELGKAANEIEKKFKPIDEKPDFDSEQQIAQYMDSIVDIENITYADLIEELDKEVSRKIRANLKKLKDKMTITLPNINFLLQMGPPGDSNDELYKAALESAESELGHVERYATKYALKSLNSTAGMLERMGVDSKLRVENAGNIELPDFLRAIAANPNAFDDLEVEEVDEDATPEKMAAFASKMMGAINKVQQGDPKNTNPEDGKNAINLASKIDPLIAIMKINPYDYANSWDILIQQYNIKPLTEKLAALGSYVQHVNGKASEDIMKIFMALKDDSERIMNEYRKEFTNLRKEYDGQMNPLDEEYSRLFQNQDAPGAFDRMIEIDLQRELINKRHDLAICNLNRAYFTRFKAVQLPAWHKATPIAFQAYRKLEKHIPKMYQSAIMHIAFVTDKEVRQQQEDKLISIISNGTLIGIRNVIFAYGLVGDAPVTKEELEEKCSEEAMRQLQRDAQDAARSLKAIHDAKANAFKNFTIDENSSFYKDYVKKWEYEFNIPFLFNYRSNDHFTASNLNIWTPTLSFDKSTYQNHITGKYYQDGGVSIRAGYGPVSGEVVLRNSFVRDEKGVVHPIDTSTDVSVGYSKGPFTLSGGYTYSSQRGSKIYRKLEYSGNNNIDGLRQESFNKLSKTSPSETPSLTLWKGEYKLD